MTNGNLPPSENPPQPPQPSISQELKDTLGQNTSEVARPASPDASQGGRDSSEVERKPKTLLLALAIVLFAAGLIFASYQLGQNRQAKSKLSPSETISTPTSSSLPTFAPSLIPTIPPTLIPSLTPTPNPTADWKTYVNEKLNYQIGYPDSWKLEEKNPDLKTWITLFKGVKDQYGRYSCEINVQDWFIEGGVDEKVDVEEIKLDADEGGLCVDGEEGGTCVESQPPQQISVKSSANISNYYYAIKASGKRLAYIPIPKNNQKFIKIGVSNWPEKESYEIFNQILSTFKFLN